MKAISNFKFILVASLFLEALPGCGKLQNPDASSPPAITATKQLVSASNIASVSSTRGLQFDAKGSKPAKSRVRILQEKLATVTVEDGINASEADIIARCYFQQHIGCGYVRGVLDGGVYWVVEGAQGIEGSPMTGFLVNKLSGEVTFPNSPSYQNPLDIYARPK